MNLFETERLAVRELTLDDAPFILRLVNDPAWLEFIGDRGVRTVAAARDYLEARILRMYREHGFGLWLVSTKADGVPIGICGLLKRPTLDDVDLGYALMPEFRGHGYAQEAARGTLVHGEHTRGLKRIIALTAPKNARSITLLERLGFRYERTVPFPTAEDLSAQFAWTAPA